MKKRRRLLMRLSFRIKCKSRHKKSRQKRKQVQQRLNLTRQILRCCQISSLCNQKYAMKRKFTLFSNNKCCQNKIPMKYQLSKCYLKDQVCCLDNFLFISAPKKTIPIKLSIIFCWRYRILIQLRIKLFSEKFFGPFSLIVIFRQKKRSTV